MTGVSQFHGDGLPRFEVMVAETDEKGLSILHPDEDEAWRLAIGYARRSMKTMWVIDRCGGMRTVESHEVWEFDPKIIEMRTSMNADPVVMMITRKISLRGKIPFYWEKR